MNEDNHLPRDSSAMRKGDVLHRYGRQMILPCVGNDGQALIFQARVLLVGAGGIGSSAAMYLATAGVNLSIIDHDTVDKSNLHRQVIHDEKNQGINKAESAIERLMLLNPSGNYFALTERLQPSNALRIISDFDIVVDATDNFSARYVINDACVLLKKPFVTGSAVGLEGQITVIFPHDTACYRCLYPNPSQSENCRSCANAGILGPVAGMIGCLEAIETIKLILQYLPEAQSSTSSRNRGLEVLKGRQMIYDASSGDTHLFDLPARNPNCTVCGIRPTITDETAVENFIAGMNLQATVASQEYLGGELPSHQQVTCLSYYQQYQQQQLPFHLLIDVRIPHQYQLTQLRLEDMIAVESLSRAKEYLSNSHLSPLPRAITFNLPLSELQENLTTAKENSLSTGLHELLTLMMNRSSITGPIPIYFICRRGIDSTVATNVFRRYGTALLHHPIFNITGGLVAWKETVDPQFPMY